MVFNLFWNSLSFNPFKIRTKTNNLGICQREYYTCFLDFKKAYNHLPRDKLWTVLLEYVVRGQLLAAMKLLYKESEVFFRVNGMKKKLFSVSIGLRQGYVLFHLLFIIYMDKIDRDSSSSSGATFGECNTRRLLFADNLALLSLYKSDVQYELDRFSGARLKAGIKISTAKIEIMCLSRHPVLCSFRTNGVTLQKTEKFKNLGVTFSSDSRQDDELGSCIGKASAVMRQLYQSVVLKRELCKKAKLSVFRSVFVPILTYGNECRVMTE